MGEYVPLGVAEQLGDQPERRAGTTERETAGAEQAAGQAKVPENFKVISDLETLKVLAQPLRQQIVSALQAQPDRAMSVKELAKHLDMPQTRLYHHMKLLVQHGVVKVAEQRLVSGIVEQRYSISAYRLTVDKALFDPEQGANPALAVYLAMVLDGAHAAILGSLAAGLISQGKEQTEEIAPDGLVLGRIWYRMTDAEVARFNERMTELQRDFLEQDVRFERGPAPESEVPTRPYEFLLGFYPIVGPEVSSATKPEQPEAGGES